MRFDHAQFHLEEMSRRDALRLGAGATLAATAAVAFDIAGADAVHADNSSQRGDHGPPGAEYDDEMFDVQAVIDGAWVPSRYGADDQRGTLNEITPRRTARAMNRVRGGKVTSYQLGEEMFNGFPAFPSEPPRLHDMFLYAFGYDAGPDFAAGGGIQSGTEPLGPNLVTGHEERFAENFTLQIGTQIDGLGHVGVGPSFYNGYQAQDLASPTGLTALGNETMGPLATRGVILESWG